MYSGSNYFLAFFWKSFATVSAKCTTCPTCSTLVSKKWCAIGRGQSALARILLLGGRPAWNSGQVRQASQRM